MKKLALLILIAANGICSASGVSISKPILYIEGTTTYALFNLSWENAWNNERNNDAIWLFCKLRSGKDTPKHISVSPTGHQVVNVFAGEASNLQFKTAEDGAGLFVFPSDNFRGDIEVSLKVVLEPGSFKGITTRNASFDIFGVEMVMIPSGGYFLGSPDTQARNRGAFYTPGKDGTDGLIKIESENQEVEIAKNGALYYQAAEGYEGDQKGTIPPAYPKGFTAFYIMKYELTEGQYVDFLNNLSQSQRQNRIIDQEKSYNGTIAFAGDKFSTEYPNRPCSFVGWDDSMAFADWAGLRPMTEFEYTKAARGPTVPKGTDFPWGSAGKEHIQRLPDKNGSLIMLNGWDESQMADANKKYFGASFYWVMDLSGSLWERVITVGHEKGRSFQGTHGDGVLTEKGKATNRDWPDGNENSGGIGFRGGGFYGYNREYHDFNPFSPVAVRPYGGWHGGMRSVAYGTRFVRTMD